MQNALTVMLAENDGQLPEGDFYFAYNKNPGEDEAIWFHLEDGKLVERTAKPTHDTTDDKVWASSYENRYDEINERSVKITPIIGIVKGTEDSSFSNDHVEVLCVVG